MRELKEGGAEMPLTNENRKGMRLRCGFLHMAGKS
jgi:hypothetical protein